MDRPALLYAFKTLALYAGLSIGGGLTLWTAIWLPTWLLMRLGGWPFIDAYMMGAPLGILVLCLIGIGVITYRHKAHEQV